MDIAPRMKRSGRRPPARFGRVMPSMRPQLRSQAVDAPAPHRKLSFGPNPWNLWAALIVAAPVGRMGG